ncbi:MAG: hypothetical protein OSA98_18475, partial [Rubripirellula sp.]|nr:hypothetical protein [Rubripirellula sp.]
GPDHPGPRPSGAQTKSLSMASRDAGRQCLPARIQNRVNEIDFRTTQNWMFQQSIDSNRDLWTRIDAIRFRKSNY